MSVNGKFGEIAREDCLALADRFGVGEAPSILDQVRKVVEDWPAFAKNAGVQPGEITRIRAQLRPI